VRIWINYPFGENTASIRGYTENVTGPKYFGTNSCLELKLNRNWLSKIYLPGLAVLPLRNDGRKLFVVDTINDQLDRVWAGRQESAFGVYTCAALVKDGQLSWTKAHS
jgi:hypothetical protein